MMRCNTHQGVWHFSLHWCPKITGAKYFSLFLARHTHNKTLSCRKTEGWEDFGHYLAKEYNLGCIYILYISSMLFFASQQQRFNPALGLILMNHVKRSFSICASAYLLTDLGSLYLLSLCLHIYQTGGDTLYYSLDNIKVGT